MELLELLFGIVAGTFECGDLLIPALRYWRTLLSLAAAIAATVLLCQLTDSRTCRILAAVHLPVAGLVGGVLWEARSGRLR